jgi:ABC-type dipeptide/oligopeptide/nickel transport system ATPase component
MNQLVEIRGINIGFTGERIVYVVNDLSLSLGTMKAKATPMARALEMLEVVRVPSAKRRLDACPHGM